MSSDIHTFESLDAIEHFAGQMAESQLNNVRSCVIFVREINKYNNDN